MVFLFIYKRALNKNQEISFYFYIIILVNMI